MQLFFRKIGETGPAIVILHGVFGSADNWATIQKHIAEAGYTVYALDARNHGRSPWSDDFSYEIMAEDLIQFIDNQSLIKPIIIGHSMGGKVVMQFAMKYPDAFSKMIVVDIAPKFYPSHHGHILQAFNLIDLSKFTSRNDVDAEFARFVPDFGERQFLMKNLGRNENNAFEWKINVAVLSREMYQIGGEMTDVRTVKNHALFIKGEKSPYIEEEDFTAIKAIFINAQIKTIAGAGHWVQAEKPKEFLETILAFLN